MVEVARQDFVMDDGRALRGLVADVDAEVVLVYCHGTPFPPVPFEHLATETANRGLGLVCWARPGYHGSTSQPHRRVASFISDARRVLDELDVTETIAFGWSGGGPHALSLGAGLHDRCRVVVTVGSVAPPDLDDLDWMAGMGSENVAEFDAALRGGEEFSAYLEAEATSFGSMSVEKLALSMASLISDVDAAALSEVGMAEMLSSSIRVATSTGINGWHDDDEAFLSPWGFELADVAVPVSLWQGGADRMVPPSHGRSLAERLPDVRAHLLDEEGHLSLITRCLDEMLDEALKLGGEDRW